MGIDLRLLNEKTCQDVAQMFDYVPGVSVDGDPPLRVFCSEDSDDFITDPEAK